MPVRGPLDSRQVVADFRQLDRGTLEHAREQHEGAHVGGRFDQIGSRHQRLTANERQTIDRQLLIAGVGVDAGTDGGSAQVHFGQQLGCQAAQAVEVFGQGGGKGAELLTQGHWNGVLQLGAAHLQHMVEFFALGGKRVN